MIAKIAKCIAASHSTFIILYKVCRLIARENRHGKRPIKITVVLSHIIGRTIVKFVLTDLRMLRGDQELCFGRGGIEDAFHTMTTAFRILDSVLILLIDTKKGFQQIQP